MIQFEKHGFIQLSGQDILFLLQTGSSQSASTGTNNEEETPKEVSKRFETHYPQDHTREERISSLMEPPNFGDKPLSNEITLVGSRPKTNPQKTENSGQQKPFDKRISICAPASLKRPISMVKLIQSGDLRVIPLIAVDFSLGNLTFTDNTCLHSTNFKKQNDYRDLIQLISHSFANVNNLPVFGYGAKTNATAPKACSFFPLSRSIRNPFTPNISEILDKQYTDCLSSLELSVPVNLGPTVDFFKNLGLHIKHRLNKKAQITPAIKDTIDCFYVLYVLTTGIIDDVSDVIKTFQEKVWSTLPVQVHLINISPNHLAAND